MQDLICKELKEAQEVLSTFLQDNNNIQRIEEAATAMAHSIGTGGKITASWEKIRYMIVRIIQGYYFLFRVSRIGQA